MKNRIKFSILIVSILSVFPTTVDGQPWSQRMADAEMARFPDASMVDYGTTARWGYCQGLISMAMLEVWHKTGEQKYFRYADDFANKMIKEDGTILTYKMDDYNIDQINAGKILFYLYDKTKQEKYRLALHTLRKQMHNHPRTSEGGFWHKLRYPHQMWLDGIYMGSPFLARYAKVFGEPELFDDVVRQITLIAKHTYDEETQLFYHGWDESREQAWANKVTGCSPCFWGRSIGWYAMALVDVLDYLPENHPGRKEVIAILSNLAKGVARFQDKKSGLWYQVTDQGKRQGNYLEASCSSMFVYALAKGAKNGYIDQKYLDVAEKGFDGIIKHLIRIDADGSISLTQCCVVAGLGGEPRRDGSFGYYISEKVSDNDSKAVGPFIMAALVLEN